MREQGAYFWEKALRLKRTIAKGTPPVFERQSSFFFALFRPGPEIIDRC
jgi:hypothetical protein